MKVFASLAIAIVLMIPAIVVASNDVYLESQVLCGERAQELMGQGEMGEAVILLAAGVKRYPDSDWLRSLYGRALFSEGRLEEAEGQFRKALEINKENLVARTLIKELRLTKDALEDRELKELVDLGMDKAGDIVVIVLGVWFGTIMAILSGRLAKRLKRSNFERALAQNDWNLVTDILEKLIANWEKAELRKNMDMMLARMPQAQVEKIIRDYVDVQKYEDELLFFLRKLHVKRK